MALKLVVRRTDKELTPIEHAFEDQSLITIGRDASADLTLYDDELMVSRLHARLELESGQYYLSDLGSRNFTSVGGERLMPGHQTPINSGDVFEVANYEVQFYRTESAPQDFGETRFETGFTNPFLPHAKDLLRLFRTMDLEYEKLPDVRKDAALAEAMGEVQEQLSRSPIFSRLAPAIDPGHGSARTDDRHRSAANAEPHAPSFRAEHADMAAGPHGRSEPAPAEQRSERIDLHVKDGSRAEKLFGVLIPFLSRQVKVPWQFRLEFIGHTFVPTSDSRAIYESEATQLAAYLLDDRCAADEFERRLDLIRDALDESLAHQMAILAGYREAVNAGTKLMIEHMDPARVQASIQEANVAFKYLSILARYKGWFVLRERHAELQREDVSVIERRTYRPAFIRSYLETMTASREERA